MNANVEVRVLPTADDVIAEAADRFVTAARDAIAASGRFVVALSGGSTPRALYRLLAARANQIDWSRVHVAWGDERCVPPDDPASNFRMAREALLDHVAVPPSQIHRMRGEDEPTRAASDYERALRTLFPAGSARFDLLLLGMGDNGHTASLFPGLTAVRETSRWVVAEDVAEVGQWRLTLTPPALNAAANALFLVTGAGKAAMLARLLEGPRDLDALPAQAVALTNGRLSWLVDASAAAALTKRP